MKKRKGIAVVVVVFFAFAISIIMFTIVQSTSNLSYQTKNTLYEMQAYYLAHSAMQFAKLHIYLLPKEIYDYYGNSSSTNGNALDKIDSSELFPMALTANYDSSKPYDLFEEGKSADMAFPFGGRFVVSKMEYLVSSDNMRMVQDSYRLRVESTVYHGRDKNHSDSLEEEFVVSRYSGR